MHLKMWQKPICKRTYSGNTSISEVNVGVEEFSLVSPLKQLLRTSSIKRLTEKECRSEQGVLQETENLIASPWSCMFLHSLIFYTQHWIRGRSKPWDLGIWSVQEQAAPMGSASHAQSHSLCSAKKAFHRKAPSANWVGEGGKQSSHTWLR